MSLETDLLLDRRRLKRRLVFWRLTAVAAGTVAVLIAVNGLRLTREGPHVARLTVNGLITEDNKLTEAVEALADDQKVKALIVRIDSPGGSVSGGETLHDAIARVAEHKPVVAIMGSLAASAGYMVAVPANRIYAREATLTGSIGVLLQTGEISGLLGKLGIAPEVVRSGPLKDEPSFVRPLSPEGRDVLQGIVNDMYEQFVSMVANGRHLKVEQVRALADGRAYTGHQALGLGLVDAIGGERDARKWLETEKKLSPDLPVEEVTTSGYASRTLSRHLEGLVQVIWKSVLSQSLSLDAPVAIWHRSAN